MSHVKCASFVFSFCHDCKFPEVSPAMLPEQPAERYSSSVKASCRSSLWLCKGQLKTTLARSACQVLQLAGSSFGCRWSCWLGTVMASAQAGHRMLAPCSGNSTIWDLLLDSTASWVPRLDGVTALARWVQRRRP
ncbi:uncharacterized protein LOC117979073 isoform X1 [Pan paniscus]|uniref:uncharacterized protein LOC117979073 isoform X1 n=1 Tax=Pan paniscus TaxID=9597 RepID=UPI0024372E8D|nr:uncharacterized protein LOC117979073 isoform X1 [Pan paniscus]